jgi:hypothetical protein
MFVPALIALTLAGGAPTCKTADLRVEALVASYARKVHADEYCQYRLYHTLNDFDGDGVDDFVLVFSLEVKGGNNSKQYLAVFPSSKQWKPIVLEVGERGERFIDDISYEEGPTIVLSTEEYEDGDPMCCPSGEGELRYKIDKGHLKLVPNPPDDDDAVPTGPHNAKPRRAA